MIEPMESATKYCGGDDNILIEFTNISYIYIGLSTQSGGERVQLSFTAGEEVQLCKL